VPQIMRAAQVELLQASRTDFDARFRPASNRIRRRWERIALAHRTGRAVPPITLVRHPDGHYVIDGCHRVSVVEDLERMPFGDGAFDVVTAFNSVLYAADPRRALLAT
jgi:Methyltransferase domain